jgi:putative SOS response-associated peptidase YedK
LDERFRIVNRLDGLAARDNIAPGPLVPVVMARRPNEVVLMRWGLIPHGAKDQKTADQMINARIEALTQRPAYRAGCWPPSAAWRPPAAAMSGGRWDAANPR